MQNAQPIVSQVVDAIAPLLLSLLVAALSWLTVLVQRKVKSETVRDMTLRLSELTQTVVLEVGQTVVARMKDAAKDGVISKEEAEDARDLALAKLRMHLGTKGESEAMKVLGFDNKDQLEAYLIAHVEAAVVKAKSQFGTKLVAAIGITEGVKP